MAHLVSQRTITTPEQAKKLVDFLTGLSVPYTITVREGKVRSLSQNALIHVWYGQIAKQLGDRDLYQVKGQCHIDYGVDIRRRDPLFCFVWDQALSKLPYEKQCAFFEKQYRRVEGEEGAAPVMQMTSAMTTGELSEYMQAMSVDYLAQGVRLTIPDEGGYEL